MGGGGGHLANLQSEAMWPAPPHLVQTVVLVMLRVSVLCHGRRILVGGGGAMVLFWGCKGIILGCGGGHPGASLTGYHPPAASH